MSDANYVVVASAGGPDNNGGWAVTIENLAVGSVNVNFRRISPSAVVKCDKYYCSNLPLKDTNRTTKVIFFNIKGI